MPMQGLSNAALTLDEMHSSTETDSRRCRHCYKIHGYMFEQALRVSLHLSRRRADMQYL